jgi:hypothetical protein
MIRSSSRPLLPLRSAAVYALAGALLAACSPEPAGPTANDSVRATPTPPPLAQRLPAPRPALSRAQLIESARVAASAFAAGEQTPAGTSLVGRSFAVRLPFGCAGAQATDTAAGTEGLASWSWGEDRRTITLRLTPADWTGSSIFAEAEAVEGFWLARPWLATESCPRVAVDPLQSGDAPASAQTVGLAAVFAKGGSRLGRRNGRAYTFTLRAEEDRPLEPARDGYRLLLEGRVGSYPDGRAIACRAAGPDQRPVCVAAVELDRVAFEGADGAVLSEWRPG